MPAELHERRLREGVPFGGAAAGLGLPVYTLHEFIRAGLLQVRELRLPGERLPRRVISRKSLGALADRMRAAGMVVGP